LIDAFIVSHFCIIVKLFIWNEYNVKS